MIALQVENYCQNCPDFKPYCSVFKTSDLCGNETVETLVQCTKKDRCKEIKAYIEQQMARKERPDYMTTCVNKWENATNISKVEDTIFVNGGPEMTKQEAAVILEKLDICHHTPTEICCRKSCSDCESNVTDKEIHKAIAVAAKLLKEENHGKG